MILSKISEFLRTANCIFSRQLYPQSCLLCLRPEVGANGVCHTCQEKIVYPEKACVLCALPIHTRHRNICQKCQNSPPAFSQTIAGFLYAPPMKQLVRLYKYRGMINMSHTLSAILHSRIVSRNGKMPDCIIPMPLHRKRLCERGFNQAEEVAKYLAARLSVRLLKRVLKKKEYTKPQTSCSRNQRLQNPKGSFTLRREVRGRTIALVDDVITTGSTAHQASRCLLEEGGAKQVILWVLARTPYN